MELRRCSGLRHRQAHVVATGEVVHQPLALVVHGAVEQRIRSNVRRRQHAFVVDQHRQFGGILRGDGVWLRSISWSMDASGFARGDRDR